MQNVIAGPAFVLGDDVDTDQIIPAEYLSYNPAVPDERKYFGMYAMAGVPPGQSGLPHGHVRFVEEGQFSSRFRIVVGGRNFGCGSSREHAPLALAEAGATVVVARFYARIFFRNCVNGGYLLPCESSAPLTEEVRTGDACRVDVTAATFTNVTRGATFQLQPLGDVRPIIEAGGIFPYAERTGQMRG